MERRHRTQLRKGSVQDAVDVAAIYETARAEMTYLPVLHTRDETLSYFANLLQTYDSVVVTAEPDIVGFVIFEQHVLHHLYVRSDHRRQGIGSALLEWVKAQSQGDLELWTFQYNLTARRFFERHGLVCEEETDGSHNEEKVPDARYVWSGP